VWTGDAWECPQLVSLGDKHALLFSVWEPGVPHYEAYAIGSIENGDFVIESWGRLTYGDSYYAGSRFTDAEGRPGLIYWLRGVEDAQGKWAGAHSVPHLLRLDESNRLVAEPHPNVTQRRESAVKITEPAPEVKLPSAADVAWGLSGAHPATLTVRSNDGTPVMHILASDHDLQIEIADQTWTMPTGVQVRLVLDAPVVELFGTAGVFAALIPSAGGRTISITNSACSIHEV
jgi:beta-fructofuranosidase